MSESVGIFFGEFLRKFLLIMDLPLKICLKLAHYREVFIIAKFILSEDFYTDFFEANEKGPLYPEIHLKRVYYKRVALYYFRFSPFLSDVISELAIIQYCDICSCGIVLDRIKGFNHLVGYIVGTRDGDMRCVAVVSFERICQIP